MTATSKAHASTMFLFIHRRQKRAIAMTRKERGGRNVSQALPFVLRASLVIERRVFRELAYSACRSLGVAREELMSHSNRAGIPGGGSRDWAKFRKEVTRLDVILTGLFVVRHAYSKAVTCLSVKWTNRMVVNEYRSCIYLSVCDSGWANKVKKGSDKTKPSQ